MKTISVQSQKGGVGKSSICIALAVAAEQAGLSVAVFDLDPQGSSLFWAERRKAELGEAGATPVVRAVPVNKIQFFLDASRDAGADLVIIDSPPTMRVIASEAASVADFVLVPSKPEVFDITSSQKTVTACQQINKPVAVVLTHCPVSGSEVAQAQSLITKQGALVAPVLYNRKAYGRSQLAGLSPQEFEPNGKAANEVRELYTFTLKHLGMKNGKKTSRTR